MGAIRVGTETDSYSTAGKRLTNEVAKRKKIQSFHRNPGDKIFSIIEIHLKPLEIPKDNLSRLWRVVEEL